MVGRCGRSSRAVPIPGSTRWGRLRTPMCIGCERVTHGGRRSMASCRPMRVAEWTAERSLEAVAGLALVFTIEGNGFLPHMVRNLVGSLTVIGAGDAPVSWMETLLLGRDRRHAAPTAPPYGLSLWRVRYD